MPLPLRLPRARGISQERVALARVARVVSVLLLYCAVFVAVALRGAVLLHHLVLVVAVKVQSRAGCKRVSVRG